MRTVESLLIVDDNPGDIELTKLTLEEAGGFQNILTARDGKEALELFTEHQESGLRAPDRFPPKVILLDINMPRMDGFEFLEAYGEISKEQTLRGEDPSVIVMVSSSTDDRDRKRCERFPMVKDFLSKPPSKEDAERIAERFGRPTGDSE